MNKTDKGMEKIAHGFKDIANDMANRTENLKDKAKQAVNKAEDAVESMGNRAGHEVEEFFDELGSRLDKTK